MVPCSGGILSSGNPERGTMVGWIDVKQWLPDTNTWVLVVIDGVVQRTACRLGKDDNLVGHWEWANEDADPAPLDAVTYWMPLPEPPET